MPDLNTAVQKTMEAGPRTGEPVESEEDFHAGREGRIGGSEHGDLLDLEPWGCSRKLAYRKSGARPDEEQEETAAMTSGKRLEPVGRNKYLEDYPSETLRGHNLRFSPPPGLPSWLGANVDADILGVEPLVMTRRASHDHNYRPEPYIWECKVRDRWGLGRIRQNGMPPAIRFQLLMYQLMAARRYGLIYIYQPHPEDYLVQVNTFDSKDLERVVRVIELGNAFWDMLDRGELPARKEAGYPACQRCPWRETCWQGPPPKRESDIGEELVKVEDPLLASLVREYLDVREEEKSASERKKAISTAIMEGLVEAGHARVQAAGHRVYRTVPEKILRARLIRDLKATPEGRAWLLDHIQSIDTKAVRKDWPELVENNIGTGTPRLNVY